MASNATSFNDIIQADRKKRSQQSLAQEILGSKGVRKPVTGPGASFSSRVGVTKRSSSAQPKPSIDGKWGHDLHHVNNPRLARVSQLTRTLSASSVERGLQREASSTATDSQVNVHKPVLPQISIKGRAGPGPYVVVATNFAPGTTAADIQAAMEPVGGEITSCRLVSASPTVMAEIIFPYKDGADNVIATFNNQKADGRLLYVYLKQGGPTPHLHPLQTAAQDTVSQSSREPQITMPVTRRSAPPVRMDRELMDVDDEDDSRVTRDRRQESRDNYDQRDRGGGSYQDGRYGFRDPNNQRDNRRDYGGNNGGYRGGRRDRQYRR